MNTEDILRFDLELNNIEEEIKNYTNDYEQTISTLNEMTLKGVNKGLMIAFEQMKYEEQPEMEVPIESFTSHPSMTNVEYATESLMERAKLALTKVKDNIVRFFKAIFNFISKLFDFAEKKAAENENEIAKEAKNDATITYDEERHIEKLEKVASDSAVCSYFLSNGNAGKNLGALLAFSLEYIENAAALQKGVASSFEEIFDRVFGYDNTTDMDVYEYINRLQPLTDFTDTTTFTSLVEYLGIKEPKINDTMRDLNQNFGELLSDVLPDKKNAKRSEVREIVPELYGRLKSSEAIGKPEIKTVLPTLTSSVEELDVPIGVLVRTKGDIQGTLMEIGDTVSTVSGRMDKKLGKFKKTMTRYIQTNKLDRSQLTDLNEETNLAMSAKKDIEKTLMVLAKFIAEPAKVAALISVEKAKIKSVQDNYGKK